MTGPYRPKPKWAWFVQRPGYIRFMIRELTAVFIGAYLIFLLVLLSKLGRGEASFTALLATLHNSFWELLHVAALIAAVWHTITWFNATPQALPVFIGENRAPNVLVAIGMGYGPWIMVSAVILWGVLR